MKLMTFETVEDKGIYSNMLILETVGDVEAYSNARMERMLAMYKKLDDATIPVRDQVDRCVRHQHFMENALSSGKVITVNDHAYFGSLELGSNIRIIKQEVIGAEKIVPFLEGNIFEVDSTIFGTGWHDKNVDARECLIFFYLKDGVEHREFIHINGWEFYSANYNLNYNFAFREASDLAVRRASFLKADKYDWCFMFGPDKDSYRYDFDNKEMFFKSAFMPHVGRFNMAYEELMKLMNEDDKLQSYSIQSDIDERNFWRDDFNMWILPDGSCIYVDWAMHERLMKFLGYNVSEKELEWVRVSGHSDYAQVYTHNYMTDAQKNTLNKLMLDHPETYSESDALKYRKRKEEKENAKVQRL